LGRSCGSLSPASLEARGTLLLNWYGNYEKVKQDCKNNGKKHRTYESRRKGGRTGIFWRTIRGLLSKDRKGPQGKKKKVRM